MQRPQFTIFLLILCCITSKKATAQWPDQVYSPSIQSIKLYKAGDPLSYPLIQLGTTEQLELHFDELNAGPKNYYYTLQLCQADWTPAVLQPYDYLKGFISNRIRNYRPSSLSQNRYTHYQLTFPESNSGPTRSGNYLLKVFLNDDTSKLIFTRRVLVVVKKVAVSAQVRQPFDGQLLLTHQQVQVSVTPLQVPQNNFSPMDLRVQLLQNRVWSTSHIQKTPTVYRGNYFEYTDESFSVFPAGQEWRWVDLRSFRLRSERISSIQDNDSTSRVDVFVNPDGPRSGKMSLLNRDINGAFVLESRDNPNVLFQGEYAWVHFTYFPPGGQPYRGRDVYIFGELTGYQLGPDNRMDFDLDKGCYTKALFLKQGYYNYLYMTNGDGAENKSPVSVYTEGNYWGTENEYLVLVYCRTVGSRADELIGYTQIHSAFQR
jgi:hypothetical protein